MTNGSLMKVESIAECSPWSILQYFWPALSDNWSWKPIFGPFFESGHSTQALLYGSFKPSLTRYMCIFFFNPIALRTATEGGLAILSSIVLLYQDYFMSHFQFPIMAEKALETRFSVRGAQWLSGRVLDSRLKGHRFEPHWLHWVVVLEQDTFILA